MNLIDRYNVLEEEQLWTILTRDGNIVIPYNLISDSKKIKETHKSIKMIYLNYTKETVNNVIDFILNRKMKFDYHCYDLLEHLDVKKINIAIQFSDAIFKLFFSSKIEMNSHIHYIDLKKNEKYIKCFLYDEDFKKSYSEIEEKKKQSGHYFVHQFRMEYNLYVHGLIELMIDLNVYFKEIKKDDDVDNDMYNKIAELLINKINTTCIDVHIKLQTTKKIYITNYHFNEDNILIFNCYNSSGFFKKSKKK
jgi:hypothetical protein